MSVPTSSARFVAPSCAAMMLVVGGCGGADGPVTPAVANFAGEYTYSLGSAGGDCSMVPSAYGYGVDRVTQSGSSATMCWQSEECDGESCQSGTIEGNEFRYAVTRTVTDGACTYVRTTAIVATRQPDGALLERGDITYAYAGGDCSDRRLPCANWYAAVHERCASPCYDAFCSRLRSGPGAGDRTSRAAE